VLYWPMHSSMKIQHALFIYIFIYWLN